MRIVLDTNVLISGLVSKDGAPAELLRLWAGRKFTLVTSLVQISEFKRVVGYERVQRRIHPEQAAELLQRMRSSAYISEQLTPVTVSADPDDNLILATALAGNADLLVSGDKQHVLGLGRIGRVEIITPRDALERVRPRT